LQRLKLKYDEALSNFAFKFNLCRYCSARGADLFESIAAEVISAMILGRSLHSSIHQLNLSRFSHKIHPKHPQIPIKTPLTPP
jgi:hypothetical protein